MSAEFTREQFQKWGAQGGRVGRPRILTREQALAMVAAKRAKKAGAALLGAEGGAKKERRPRK